MWILEHHHHRHHHHQHHQRLTIADDVKKDDDDRHVYVYYPSSGNGGGLCFLALCFNVSCKGADMLPSFVSTFWAITFCFFIDLSSRPGCPCPLGSPMELPESMAEETQTCSIFLQSFSAADEVDADSVGKAEYIVLASVRAPFCDVIRIEALLFVP